MRLIASDLDGTFLDEAGRIPSLNALAAARAAESGIPFVVATGRPIRWLDVLAPLAAAHPLVIASNGAVVWDLGARRVVERTTIAAAAAAEAVRLLHTIDGLTVGIETEQGFGCEPGCPSRAHHDAFVAPAADLLEQPVLKLLGYHTGLATDELTARATALLGDLVTVTQSAAGGGYGLVEISAPGITKASALATLCDQLGIEAAEVAAFGDMPNDVAMLSWAGLPHVVANAHPAVLALGFPVIAAADQAGVGHRILELLEEPGSAQRQV